MILLGIYAANIQQIISITTVLQEVCRFQHNSQFSCAQSMQINGVNMKV